MGLFGAAELNYCYHQNASSASYGGFSVPLTAMYVGLNTTHIVTKYYYGKIHVKLTYSTVVGPFNLAFDERFVEEDTAVGIVTKWGYCTLTSLVLS